MALHVAVIIHTDCVADTLLVGPSADEDSETLGGLDKVSVVVAVIVMDASAAETLALRDLLTVTVIECEPTERERSPDCDADIEWVPGDSEMESEGNVGVSRLVFDKLPALFVAEHDDVG